MGYTMISWALMALMVVGTVGAQDDVDEGSHAVTFEAPGGGGPPVTLQFEGKVYGPTGWWLDQLDPKRLDEAETFVRNVIAINREGDVDAMANLWHADEREAFRASAGEELFERNQGWYKTVSASVFRSRVDFGEFKIFFVQHDSTQTESGATTVNVYPVRKIDGRLYLTNALQDEFAFRYLVLVYRGRLIEQPSTR